MRKLLLIAVIAGALFLSFTEILYAQGALININTATSIELQTLNGIGPVKAQAIIDYRNVNGPFESIEEIKNVRGIGEVTFANIEAYITIGEEGSAAAVVLISGTITTDTTWSPEEGTYVLENVVTVSSSTTLTILPGTVIKGKHGGAGALIVAGALRAVGTSESKIYFTSFSDDTVGGDADANGSTSGAPGDWQGLYFTGGSTGELEYVEVNYAGYGPGFPSYGHFSGIENDGGTLDIRHSAVRNNYKIISNGGGGLMSSGKGIYNRSGILNVSNSVVGNSVYGIDVEAGTVTISNSVIENNIDSITSSAGYGIYASGGEYLTLLDNTFTGNKKTAFINAQVSFSHSGNTSTDLANRGFEINGLPGENASWQTSDLPIIIPNGALLWIPTSHTLTIEPGSLIKFGSAAQMIVEGGLVIRGSEGREVYFTSLKDDVLWGDTNNDGSASFPNAMDWNGIEFRSGSTGQISHTLIQYTGGYNGLSRAAIYNLGGDVLLDHITFSNNYLTDFYQTTGSSTISHSLFSTGTNAAVSNNSTSTLDARYNWWGVATGPTHSTNATGTGAVISDNIIFNPWLRRNPTLPNPVIIVPGITSSRLNSDDAEKWPNTVLMTLSVDDLYLDDLSMNIDGQSVNSIFASSIIKELGSNNYFNNLIFTLELNKYISEETLFEYPYDWRLDIQYLATDLKNKIDQIKIITGTQKVDLVAHSMGGLLVKKYIQDYGGSALNKFIDIGTPHVGSPKALKILNYGDNLDISFLFGSIGLNAKRIKNITQNMPSIYQLLPSQKYFENSDLNYYVFNGINGNNGNKRLTFSQTEDYLKAEGRNAALVDRANEFHQEIDDLNPLDYGVETYNIVGCGTPTIGHFYLLEGGAHPVYNIGWIDGDGTVPLKSAEALQATQTYYVKDAKHALMPSTSGVRELVASILTEDDLDLSSYGNLALNSNDCQFPNGKVVSLHSPIELHIYDALGNHSGPNESGDIENEIFGVTYEMIGDNKFAFLPNGVQYKVQGSATDAGTFDTRIQEIVDGEVVNTTLFTDIPLTLTTQMNFDVDSDIPTQIYLDHENDGVFETSQTVSTTTSGIIESTGKMTISAVPTVTSSSASKAGGSRSMPATTVEATALPLKISQSILTTETGVLSSSVAQSQSPGKVEKPIAADSQVQEKKYKNTAIVYKSMGHRIINFFKNIWAWITSKL